MVRMVKPRYLPKFSPFLMFKILEHSLALVADKFLEYMNFDLALFIFWPESFLNSLRILRIVLQFLGLA